MGMRVHSGLSGGQHSAGLVSAHSSPPREASLHFPVCKTGHPSAPPRVQAQPPGLSPEGQRPLPSPTNRGCWLAALRHQAGG